MGPSGVRRRPRRDVQLRRRRAAAPRQPSGAWRRPSSCSTPSTCSPRRSGSPITSAVSSSLEPASRCEPRRRPGRPLADDVEGCCDVRKVEPLERALAGQAAWITGVRRVDGPTRANTPVVEWDVRRDIVKVNPLATWTDDDMAPYRAPTGCPSNPLVAKGYLSIGCWPCTRPVAPARTDRRRPLGRPGQDRVRAAPMIDASLTSTSSRTRRSRSSARSPPSASSPCCCSRVARTRRCCLHLARLAFAPARLPFPLLHVDTGHNFPEVLAYRDRLVAPSAAASSWPACRTRSTAGRVVEEPGPPASRNRLQSVTLLDAHRRARLRRRRSAAAAATRTERGPRSASCRARPVRAAGTHGASGPSRGRR